MTHAELSPLIIEALQADAVTQIEVIQPLWNNYGELLRVHIEHNNTRSSVVVKHIQTAQPSQHPRGWAGHTSHQRKVKSYEVEFNWYHHWAPFCEAKVPQVLAAFHQGENSILILEDLAKDYPSLGHHLNLSEVKTVLVWLATFHAQYLDQTADDLWPIGTYWHLKTRLDEYKAMEDGALKNKAHQIDDLLQSAKYKTIVHGDAKVANFCFSRDFKAVSAVDFQYVGSGVGIKDVMYFIGSCLNHEEQALWETDLLNHYFAELSDQIKHFHSNIDATAVCAEWRKLYPIAIADFERFLAGWMPSHHKRNNYTQQVTLKALSALNK